MPLIVILIVAIVGLMVSFWLVGAVFSLLWSLLIGFIAGAIAKFVMPGHDGGGFLTTALLGIAGSLVASLLGRISGWYQPGEAAGFIAAIVGAIIILAVYRVFKSSKASVA